MTLQTHHHERRTLWVVLLTAATMVVEITYGLLTNSMALLADGIHMGSHVLAIGLSWLAYVVIRRLNRKENSSFSSEKILSLSGYTSGLLLLVFAAVIVVEAIQRFYNPREIQYIDAITIATIGLVVNIGSAFLLHHDKEHSDHNIKAAYLHVLADALTSIAAIVGLLIARYLHFSSIDPMVAIVSSLVIIRWSVGLLVETGKVLLHTTTKQPKEGK